MLPCLPPLPDLPCLPSLSYQPIGKLNADNPSHNSRLLPSMEFRSK